MKRSSVVILMVLLVYLSVLNFLVAHVLYLRYLRTVAATQPDAPTARNGSEAAVAFASEYAGAAPREGLRTQSTPGLHTQTRSRAAQTCPTRDVRTDIAVRVTRMETELSNEVAVAPVVRLLAALRTRLLSAGREPVRVWLVVRPEHFLSLYRLWCTALRTDSGGSCACEVLFASSEQHAAIAWLVLRREACAARLFLLDDAFELPRRLFARSTGPPPEHVLRLDACAPYGRESLFLPACFLHRCVLAVCGRGTLAQTDADISAIAAGAGRYACA